MTDAAIQDPQKPCVALLGEFSAGKSTLANILLGSARSLVRVTATQMPPIVYVAGHGDPVRVRDSGEEMAIAPDDIGQVPLDGTRFLRVPVDAPILDQMDLIDMPGSADPNMSPDIWNDLLPRVDIAVWCTPAMQAWRQSEAALWQTVSDRIGARSLLLLTRFDKVAGALDQGRVLSRVSRETKGLFRSVLPMSLIGPEAAPVALDDPEMAQFCAALHDVIAHPVPRPAAPPDQPDQIKRDSPVDAAPGAPRLKIVPRRVGAVDLSAARPRARRAHTPERMR